MLPVKPWHSTDYKMHSNFRDGKMKKKFLEWRKNGTFYVGDGEYIP